LHLRRHRDQIILITAPQGGSKHSEMNAFIAHIIYRIACEGVVTEQYDEQWRLIFADEERSALEEARSQARTEESSFQDRHGRNVNWELVAVKELREVELENGTLLLSMVKEIEPIAAPVWMQ
jgi:hypothetical protein